jgi:hypothetical protein
MDLSGHSGRKMEMRLFLPEIETGSSSPMPVTVLIYSNIMSWYKNIKLTPRKRILLWLIFALQVTTFALLH